MDQIWRRPYSTMTSNYSALTIGVRCEEGDRFMGGGCMLTPFSPVSTLTQGGYQSDADVWWCGWNSRTASQVFLESQAVCLRPSSGETEALASCECPPVEPVIDRILHVERGGIVASDSVYRLASTCDPGQLLVGGGCQFDTGSWSEELTLISSGFNADRSEWACTWKNRTFASFAATATATCIRPPTPGTAPEAEPLTDRIDIITQTTTLPASDAHIADASCAPGDFLLWGSCTLDSPADHPDVTMFRSGFLPPEQNRPNTWQCGWNNPTALAPTGAATAVCLKPPSN
jgi:hypothetical protein